MSPQNFDYWADETIKNQRPPAVDSDTHQIKSQIRFYFFF